MGQPFRCVEFRIQSLGAFIWKALSACVVVSFCQAVFTV